MAKTTPDKNEHSSFLHLGEVIHNMEHGVAAAYDWLTGPAMSEQERDQHKLQETEISRRTDTFGF
ncbi:MAG: hypothetical protein O2913_06530 [Chloroflexi bacterium]|nr:hypothetical protein [Chloroflexota bacterium]